MIYDQLVEPGTSQGVDMMFYEGLTSNTQQRLGGFIRQWTHALSPPRRQYHGPHGCVRSG
jgi:hypothetical protein